MTQELSVHQIRDRIGHPAIDGDGITGQELTVDGGVSVNFPYAGLGGH